MDWVFNKMDWISEKVDWIIKIGFFAHP